ncbi:hypothetical protein MHU86_10924 [Fragilaria crotonensis]|nr:hypothetical protein MHU86_10924 [Fragilaria crotonensis]
MIGCCLQGYASLTTRLEKGKYLSAVVDTIHKSGGRFLQRRPRGEGWEQDDFQKARQTVGQALRDFNKKSEAHLESSLRNLYDRFYATPHDFDWISMVKTAQRLNQKGKILRLQKYREQHGGWHQLEVCITSLFVLTLRPGLRAPP